MLGGRLEWVFYAMSRRNALPPAQPFSALPRGSQVRGDGGRQEEAGGGGEKHVYVCLCRHQQHKIWRPLSTGRYVEASRANLSGRCVKRSRRLPARGEQQPKKNERGARGGGGRGRRAVGSRGRSAPRGRSWPGLPCRDSVRFDYPRTSLPRVHSVPSLRRAEPSARGCRGAAGSGAGGAEPPAPLRSRKCLL